MFKKRKVKRILILLLLAGMLCGCGRYSILEPQASSKRVSDEIGDKEGNGEENVFEETEADSQIIVSFEHGAKKPNRDKDGSIIPFEYDGGEFSMDYEFSAEAKGKSIGFYVFVNGKPQAYRIDDNKAEEYFHIFEIPEEDTEQDFAFHFTPMEGKKGDVLNIEVLSVFHPAFQPDMVHTQGYGFYQNCMPDDYQLKMNADAPGNMDMPEKKIVVKDIEQKKEKITKKFIEEELSSGMAVEEKKQIAETLEEDLRTSIRYDGEEILNGLDISGKKKVHCVYKICGCAGITYRTTFFANHQPVSETVETELSKEDVAILETDIDVNSLNGNSTFYAVTVPDIYARDTDKLMCTMKSPSVLFYGGTPGTETGSGQKNVKMQKSQAERVLKTEKVTDVFYGKDSELLLQVDKKLYAYDMKNKEVKGGADISGFGGEFSMRRYENGYVLIGKDASASFPQNGEITVSSGEEDRWKWKVVFYDFTLKKGQEILLSDVFGKKMDIFDDDSIAVSHDGKKIAIIDANNHIYLYRSGKKKVKKIWKGGRKEVIDGVEVKLGFYKIAFAADDSSIMCMGTSFSASETEDEGTPAWGILALNGNVQRLTRDVSYHPEDMYVYPKYIVLPEEFEHASGRLLKADVKGGGKKFLSFSHKEEGKDGVYVSSDGKYFATACLEKNKMVVRVYDMEKGTLLKEKTQKDKKEEYFYRCPMIFLLDDARSCIVFMGTGIEEIETKVEQFTF